MSHRGGFRLEKWYLDVVSDDGEVHIGYAARLGYGALRLTCGAWLSAAPPRPARTRTQLTGVRLPEVHDGTVRWNGLSSGPREERGPRGVWSCEQAGLQRTLLDGPDGALRWHCLHARSAVHLSWPDGRALDGLGYAERLDMTVPPWRLPLRELHWGRFVAPRSALTWIDWRGAHPLTLLLRDGAMAPAASIGDDAITLADGGSLRLSDSVVLRDGELGATALRSVPLLRAVLPPAMLGTRETKWRSRGTFARQGGVAEHGWVIHEVVRFPDALRRT